MSSSFAIGQNMEVYGGLNTNHFHDFKSEYGHYGSNYNVGAGYSFGIAVDGIQADWMSFRFTLKFDKYSGSLTAINGGLAGVSRTNAKIKKSLVSFGAFPVNLQLLKKIDFNLGFEISKLISETFQGTRSGSRLGRPDWSYDLQEEYSEYNSARNFGLNARLAYNLKVNESISISPQYCFYFGLSQEFIKFPEATKAVRHFLGIGIKKKLKTKDNPRIAKHTTTYHTL